MHYKQRAMNLVQVKYAALLTYFFR